MRDRPRRSRRAGACARRRASSTSPTSSASRSRSPTRAPSAASAACRCSKTARWRSSRAPPTASRSARIGDAALLLPLQDAAGAARRPAGRAAACPRRASAPPPLVSTLHHVAGLALAHLELRSSALGRAVARPRAPPPHATVDKVVRDGEDRHHAPRAARARARRVAAGRALLCRASTARWWWCAAAATSAGSPPRSTASSTSSARRCPHGVLPAVPAGPRRRRSKRDVMHALHAARHRRHRLLGRRRPAATAEFPEVAALRREVLELPCHQSLDDDAIDLVAQAVKQVMAHA